MHHVNVPTEGTRRAPRHSYRRNEARPRHSYRRNKACTTSMFLPKERGVPQGIPTVGTRRAQGIPTVGTRRAPPTEGTRRAPRHSYRRNEARPRHSYRRNKACTTSMFLPKERGVPRGIPTVGTRRAQGIPTVGTRRAPRQCSYRRNEACPKAFLP